MPMKRYSVIFDGEVSSESNVETEAYLIPGFGLFFIVLGIVAYLKLK
jgi:hypothetical protein